MELWNKNCLIIFITGLFQIFKKTGPGRFFCCILTKIYMCVIIMTLNNKLIYAENYRETIGGGN